MVKKSAWILIAAAATAIADPSPVAAQSSCQVIYQTATRNRSSDYNQQSMMLSIYDEYCAADGSLREKKIDTSADLVIKQIPVKFTGNYADTRQAFSNFCKKHNEERRSGSLTISERDSVVTDALRLFNECEQVRNSNVNIQITPSDDSIQFNFKLTANDKLSIMGFQASANISCILNESPTDDKQQPEKGLKLTTDFVKKVTTNFAVLCTRAAIKSDKPDGELRYAASSISIVTDKGTIGASLPVTQVFDYVTAKEVDTRFRALQDELAKARQSQAADVLTSLELSVQPQEIDEAKPRVRAECREGYTLIAPICTIQGGRGASSSYMNTYVKIDPTGKQYVECEGGPRFGGSVLNAQALCARPKPKR
ncbi:MAG: hypothetical protein IPK81_21595 [Rhodospirillales bacterium]|nr:MAG: hypothetical protein IPK81_21595 [Rhodospirillales bacterium]